MNQPPRHSEAPNSVSQRLEDAAAAFLRPSATTSTDVSRMLVHELSLILDQLRATRTLHRQLEERLADDRCLVLTELARLERRTPAYTSYSHPSRPALQSGLLALEAERRRLALTKHEQLRQLTDRLAAAHTKLTYLKQ